MKVVDLFKEPITTKQKEFLIAILIELEHDFDEVEISKMTKEEAKVQINALKDDYIEARKVNVAFDRLVSSLTDFRICDFIED
jgi:hypothetical protein